MAEDMRGQYSKNERPLHKGAGSVAVIVAALLGLVVGYALMRSKTFIMPASSSREVDLRVMLNSLEKEHVSLEATAMRNAFDKNPDFAALAGALEKNSDALAAAIGNIYDADTEWQFLEVWRTHTDYLVDYANAVQKGDGAVMEKSVADLEEFADGISDFLSGAIQNLPRDPVRDLMIGHIEHLMIIIDTYASGNYAESYVAQHDANDQIGLVADVLSEAVIKQNPGLFK